MSQTLCVEIGIGAFCKYCPHNFFFCMCVATSECLIKHCLLVESRKNRVLVEMFFFWHFINMSRYSLYLFGNCWHLFCLNFLFYLEAKFLKKQGIALRYDWVEICQVFPFRFRCQHWLRLIELAMRFEEFLVWCFVRPKSKTFWNCFGSLAALLRYNC